MTDTLLYKKNKRIGFRLILFMFLGLLAIVAVLPFSLASEDTQAEEKKLIDVFPNIYASLMDENGKIISTTDSSKEVDSKYLATSSSRYITMDDNLYLYFDAEEIENENLDKQISMGSYYYIDLPNYIIPDSSQLVTNGETEYKLFNLGKVQGYGGVYHENNKYRLKIRFENIEDSYLLDFSYQLSFKLDASILEQNEELKILSIEDIGDLSLYMKNDEVPDSYYKIEQTATQKGTSSDIYVLTTTLTDDRKESDRSLNGKLTINLGNDFGYNSYKNTDYLARMKIYIDGISLSKNPISSKTIYFENEKIHIEVTATGDVNTGKECIDNSFSCSFNAFDFIITGQNGNQNATGIHEIKIVFDEKLTTTQVRNHINEASYIDNLENKNVNTNVVVEDVPTYLSIEPKLQNYNTDSNGVPLSFTHQLNMSTNPSNYLEITTSDSITQNQDIFQYFVNASCLSMGTIGSRCSNNKMLYIDDMFVNFRVNNFDYILDYDPTVYMQIKEVLGSDFERTKNLNHIWKSESTNSDGDYYYYVLSYDTFENIIDASDNGRYEYSLGYDNQVIGSTKPIKFYLFNVSNRSVSVNFDYKLGRVIRNDNSHSGTNNNYVIYPADYKIESKVKYDYSYTTEKKNIDLSFYSKRYMTTHGEYLNNDYIKWETVIDTSEMKSLLNSYSYVSFNLYSNDIVPEYNNDVYSILDNRMINESTPRQSIGVDFLVPGLLFKGNYNSVTKKCEGNYNVISSLYFTQSNNSYTLPNVNSYGETGGRDLGTKFCLIYFTKRNQQYQPSWLQLEFDYYGQSAITKTGSSERNVIYVSNAYVNPFNDGNKSLISTNSNGTTTTAKWNLSYISINHNDKTSCYSKNADLPYNCPRKSKEYFNGNVQFYDKMDGVLAKYTTLKSVNVRVFDENSQVKSNIKMSQDELNQLDNKKCVNGTCLYISYPATLCNIAPRGSNGHFPCLTDLYGEDYLTKLTKMDNGFSLMVTGLSNDSGVEVNYETITDDLAALNEITDLNSDIKTYNYIYKNAWSYMEPYLSRDNKYKETEAFFIRKYVAALAVEKKNSTSIGGMKTYLTSDTNGYRVNVSIGQNSVSYLDLKDILTGLMEKENPTNEELLTFNKYLKVNDLIITYKDPNRENDNGVYIYRNGEFIDGWSNSTISFDKTDNGLYTLHLVKDDGDIPAYSSFQIDYKVIFDIDNYENVEGLDTYRNNDLYLGSLATIDTDVEVIIPYYDSFAAIEDTITSNNKNYIDRDNGKVHCFLDEDVKGSYLKPSNVIKITNDHSTSEIDSREYVISRSAGSAGKSVKPSFNYIDTFTYKLDSIPEEMRADFNALLLKHTTVSNMRIYDTNNNEIYVNEAVLPYAGGNIEFNSSNLTGSFNINKSDSVIVLQISGEQEQYDQMATIKYDVNLNKVDFIAEAIQNNLLDNNLKIKETNIGFSISEENKIFIELLHPVATASSGKISFADLNPNIQKSVSYPSDLEQTWTINTNTSRHIKIVDHVKANISNGSNIDNSLINDIENSISIKDIIIKIDDVIVYQNNAFKDSYGNYITITQDGLNITFEFTDEAFNSDSSDVEIKYTTIFDPISFYEKSSLSLGSFSLSNEASIERGELANSITKDSKKIEFDYPLVTNKSFIGNGNNLAISKWQIEVFAENLEKNDIVITDTMNLGTEFGAYLSLSNMVIKKIVNTEETVIYDYKNNINNIGTGITLKDKNGEELEFNKNGEYEFIINIDKLEKDNKLIIDYELTVDEEEYKADEKDTDIELRITNNALISSGEESYRKTAIGTSMVESTLKKKYKFLGINNNKALLSWDININLNVDYEGKINNDDTVIISDELFDTLKYVDGSLKVYERANDSNGNSNRLLVENEDYEFIYENNTIKVELLKPKDTSIIYIKFDTTCTTTDGLKNYVKLQVKEEVIHAESDNVPSIFTRYLGGTVLSKQLTLYSIYAKKYYNGELSSKRFKFNLQEVDILGQTLSNGTNIVAENDEEGNIVFGTIKYRESGVHFYRISEVDENEQNIEYDDKVYTVMVQVAEYNNSYVIEKAVIMTSGGNSDEIIFQNYGGETSIEVEKTWNDDNNKDGKRELVNAKVQLYKSVNGEEPTKVSGDDYLVDVPTQNGTVVKWDHLPVYENGNKITYSIEEEYDTGMGYIASTSNPVLAEVDTLKKITVTNSYSSEETTVEVKKVWNDNNNKEDKRKDLNAKVQLYKSVNGETPTKVSGSSYLVSVPLNDGIVIKWEHLPVYENKNKITYSVQEEINNTIGYEVDNGNEVLASNGEVKTITIKNTLKEVPHIDPEENSSNEPHDEPKEEEFHNVPKTSDNIIYSFISFIISLGALLYITLYLIKGKTKKI